MLGPPGIGRTAGLLLSLQDKPRRVILNIGVYENTNVVHTNGNAASPVTQEKRRELGHTKRTAGRNAYSLIPRNCAIASAMRSGSVMRIGSIMRWASSSFMMPMATTASATVTPWAAQ